jgi:pimeloyl-ACP methyl ester carboxylesterase
VGRIRSEMPHARFVALSDVGHYPHLEVPELVAREIELALNPEDRWAGGRQP